MSISLFTSVRSMQTRSNVITLVKLLGKQGQNEYFIRKRKRKPQRQRHVIQTITEVTFVYNEII